MKKFALIFLLLFLLCGCALTKQEGVRVPILLYHHIDETGDDQSTISAKRFEEQMALLKREGYNPISFDTLIGYAEQGTPLPQKPVVITFDNGYYSNYRYAYPLLKEYGFPATIFVIGCSVGHMEYYKDTDHRMTPHFGEAEIREMTKSGLISIQSHTYDMHQWAPFEEGGVLRENILPLPRETEEDYVTALTADHKKISALLKGCGVDTVEVVAFPHGKAEPLTNRTLRELGVKVTLTTAEQTPNRVLPEDPDGLIGLGRFSINETVTDEDLINYLKK